MRSHPNPDMNYVVELNGALVELAVEEGGVVIDGEMVHAQHEGVDGTAIQVLRLGSSVHQVVVRRSGGRGAYDLWVDGWRFTAEALDQRTRAIRDLTAKSSAAKGPRPLVAPMPGLITRIQVKVGDSVEAGQPLVTMEAMKMENELRSTSAGEVREVAVVPGQAVEKGAVLVELT
jgi:acetyl/propionyl-CoA carboxylase alpha subunit